MLLFLTAAFVAISLSTSQVKFFPILAQSQLGLLLYKHLRKFTVITTWYKMGLYHNLPHLWIFFFNSKVHFTAVWINYSTKVPNSHFPLSPTFHALFRGSFHGQPVLFYAHHATEKQEINHRDLIKEPLLKEFIHIHRWLKDLTSRASLLFCVSVPNRSHWSQIFWHRSLILTASW